MLLWLIAALAAPALLAQPQELAAALEDVKIERVITGYGYAEAPAWSREGHFLWADVPAGKMWKWAPGKQPESFREASNKAIGAAYDAKGNLYICESATRQLIRITAKGETEVAAARWQGKRLNSPNAVVARKDGHVYFTDPAFGSANAARELDFYGVFHLDPSAKNEPLSLVAQLKGRPNGIALSPDGKRLYVANSDEHAVYAYDLNGKGEASGERALIEDIEGVPGGITTDEKGNLYVAAKGVQIFTPIGEPVRTLDFVDQPSDVVFGGSGGNLLLITAGSSIYLAEMPWKGSFQY